MNINLLSNRPELIRAVEEVVRIYYPGVKISGEDPQFTIDLAVEAAPRIKIAGTLNHREGTRKFCLEEEFTGDEEHGNQLRRLARVVVYRLLAQEKDKTGSPWGILTGIRPTKIVHRWMDKDWTPDDIKEKLVHRYLLDPEKAELLVQVANVQRPFLPMKERSDQVSVYLGIPFCPSRCTYCSFSAEPLKKVLHLVHPYLDALKWEIEQIGSALKTWGVDVQTVYVGGGTPTCLDEKEFDHFLHAIAKSFPLRNLNEFTVEAGRPDTLNQEKLWIMKERGVSRVSINPQTMHQETLDRVGRKHTVGQVLESCFQAAELGFLINMDLILGLPGETCAQVEETFRRIGEVKPDNLTVHTLALKKKAPMNKEKEAYLRTSNLEVEKMIALSRNWSERMGMVPYYLYRQKNILGKLENTGYCLPGKECLYNIHIMEERQTVLGLGVGAGSKFVSRDLQFLTADYNPKDIACYLERIEETVKKKIDKLATIV
ncbi:coproporphyrinogen dehydrogenase HemZ [Candidatus Formimonas warabiya]|uniref:Coproporphyrinogen dehydrogenase HemZ n=1 Tax=Formimonas warabiya TaxID=1761012 RepID=A0A3G1KNG2_FORW1|nr:coproporphyrinogen dehydrogenase HemZ [Candidatus Formimonas warabiya]ATW23966.1 coproporphyrinogen dehydrogenase HemZ [Candidatus Formimonas warabiya]